MESIDRFGFIRYRLKLANKPCDTFADIWEHYPKLPQLTEDETHKLYAEYQKCQ